MTELMDLHISQKDEFDAKIRNLETDLLFMELDDTIHQDICGITCVEWDIEMRQKKAVYMAIVGELKKRFERIEKVNNELWGLIEAEAEEIEAEINNNPKIRDFEVTREVKEKIRRRILEEVNYHHFNS